MTFVLLIKHEMLQMSRPLAWTFGNNIGRGSERFDGRNTRKGKKNKYIDLDQVMVIQGEFLVA